MIVWRFVVLDLRADQRARPRKLRRVIAGQVAHDHLSIDREHGALFTSASIAASISSSVFGGPAWVSIPATSPGRVGANTGAGFSNTSLGVSLTMSRVPAAHVQRSRIALGGMTCSFVATVVVAAFAEPGISTLSSRGKTAATILRRTASNIGALRRPHRLPRFLRAAESALPSRSWWVSREA